MSLLCWARNRSFLFLCWWIQWCCTANISNLSTRVVWYCVRNLNRKLFNMINCNSRYNNSADLSSWWCLYHFLVPSCSFANLNYSSLRTTGTWMCSNLVWLFVSVLSKIPLHFQLPVHTCYIFKYIAMLSLAMGGKFRAHLQSCL